MNDSSDTLFETSESYLYSSESLSLSTSSIIDLDFELFLDDSLIDDVLFKEAVPNLFEEAVPNLFEEAVPNLLDDVVLILFEEAVPNLLDDVVLILFEADVVIGDTLNCWFFNKLGVWLCFIDCL